MDDVNNTKGQVSISDKTGTWCNSMASKLGELSYIAADGREFLLADKFKRLEEAFALVSEIKTKNGAINMALDELGR